MKHNEGIEGGCNKIDLKLVTNFEMGIQSKAVRTTVGKKTWTSL